MADLEAQIEELLARLTLKEKVALLSGTDNWHTAPLARFGSWTAQTPPAFAIRWTGRFTGRQLFPGDSGPGIRHPIAKRRFPGLRAPPFSCRC